MMHRGKDCGYPLHALSFNHRAEAFYEADFEQPDLATVSSVREKGLAKVSILHHGTGQRVAARLVQLMNLFHGGSGASFLDYMDEAVKLENAWKAYSAKNRLTTHNPKYLQLKQNFVLTTAVSSLILNSSCC